MYSKEEYLKILRADLDRLQGNSIGTENNKDTNSGITVTTTIGKKSTISTTIQPSIGNITQRRMFGL